MAPNAIIDMISLAKILSRGVLLRASAVLLALLVSLPGAGQTPTYRAVPGILSPQLTALQNRVDAGDIQAVDEFWRRVQKSGAPMLEATPEDDRFILVTFVWLGNDRTRNVVIFDGVAGFDAQDRMADLPGTTVWFKTYRVRKDARFTYNLSPNDSLQPFNDVKGDAAMKERLASFQTDPLNPHHCPGTFGAYDAESSYVELAGAPPLVWSLSAPSLPRGSLTVTTIQSALMNRQKKLWVYTPHGFTRNGKPYQLLVLFDGDRNRMWIPKLLDILIAEEKIPPTIAVMIDESDPTTRRSDLTCSAPYTDFLAEELVRWARRNWAATRNPAQTLIAGSSLGGLQAVFTGLKHPEVFGEVISLSGSFWWKPEGSPQGEWLTQQVASFPHEPLHFYMEVGLMESQPAQVDTNRRMRDALRAKGYHPGYAEFNGGHSFLTWSGGMATGLEQLSPRAHQGPKATPRELRKSIRPIEDSRK